MAYSHAVAGAPVGSNRGSSTSTVANVSAARQSRGPGIVALPRSLRSGTDSAGAGVTSRRPRRLPSVYTPPLRYR